MQLLDLRAHLHAQLGIEVAERFVEQEDLWVAYNGAPHGDALALAAGKLARETMQELFEAEDLGRPPDLFVHHRLRRLRQGQREGHVVVDRHVRVERIVLEDHRDVAILGRHRVDHPPADGDLA